MLLLLLLRPLLLRLLLLPNVNADGAMRLDMVVMVVLRLLLLLRLLWRG